MVYEECLAGWLPGGFAARWRERFDRSTSAMIRRDRNHPSVAIWGLLNETQDGPVFRQAVGFLPNLRELDQTRLVLLDSGRWDGQLVDRLGEQSRAPANGSPSGAPKARAPRAASLGAGGYIPEAGDAHVYPAVPQTPETDRFIRELGREGKPVFLSEYGIGSLMDVIGEWRRFEQIGARPDLEDAAHAAAMAERGLIADWKRLGFDGVYPFPEDLLRDSQRLHARQRTLGFNLHPLQPAAVRLQPDRACSTTASPAKGSGPSGGEWKPATFDAVSDGWSPLRWCLFAEPLHGYAGREVTVEAVLANEDVLKPGEYPARFRVFGPSGLSGRNKPW